METIIVTRHAGLVEYLRDQGLAPRDAEVHEHATPELVRGKRVIGVLPLHLAVEAAEVIEIPMNIPSELRGQELTAEETAHYAGEPRAYTVQPSVALDYLERRYREDGYTRWAIQRPDDVASLGCGMDETLEIRDTLEEALALAVVYSRGEKANTLGEIFVSPMNEREGMALPPVGAVRGKVRTLGFRKAVFLPEVS